ncbi:hypothetical protein RRG08_000123 [Elysia crispata]|uniref:Uncharacterized protein n=1 Tax=Elysia crispata TaxID=231223 RepID=A0AAE1D526_9GAST|nr:hypothetical protein RRG08_000123 [Elysia crispata]
MNERIKDKGPAHVEKDPKNQAASTDGLGTRFTCSRAVATGTATHAKAYMWPYHEVQQSDMTPMHKIIFRDGKAKKNSNIIYI